MKAFHAELKTVYGATSLNMPPIKNTDVLKLSHPKPTVNRWKEYFKDLLNRQSTSSVDALQSFVLPIQEEQGNVRKLWQKCQVHYWD